MKIKKPFKYSLKLKFKKVVFSKNLKFKISCNLSYKFT